MEVFDQKVQTQTFFENLGLYFLQVVDIPRYKMVEEVELVQVVHEVNLLLTRLVSDGRVEHSFGEEKYV